MSELYTPVNSLKINIDIVPFGIIKIIQSYNNQCSTQAEMVEDDTAYEFPSGSMIGGSVIYDQPLIYSIFP